MNYNLPGGKLGANLAQIIGADPAPVIKDDLRRFKQLMETGEIATIRNQTSGRDENAEEIEPLTDIAASELKSDDEAAKSKAA
jgi:hypothetical protein